MECCVGVSIETVVQVVKFSTHHTLSYWFFHFFPISQHPYSQVPLYLLGFSLISNLVMLLHTLIFYQESAQLYTFQCCRAWNPWKPLAFVVIPQTRIVHDFWPPMACPFGAAVPLRKFSINIAWVDSQIKNTTKSWCYLV